ncbi:MAG TPA: hypothetical protein DEF88_15490 [Porphyromonadaceae bacterium]|nr:hypothetical protein [Porphyromonadaceae bacterium]HCM21808.1 hypothetical protein [Porphyromonadaceae bacterium]
MIFPNISIRNMIYFSKNLRFLREKQKMTQGELAKLLELRSNSISNYEKRR